MSERVDMAQNINPPVIRCGMCGGRCRWNGPQSISCRHCAWSSCHPQRVGPWWRARVALAWPSSFWWLHTSPLRHVTGRAYRLRARLAHRVGGHVGRCGRCTWCGEVVRRAVRPGRDELGGPPDLFRHHRNDGQRLAARVRRHGPGGARMIRRRRDPLSRQVLGTYRAPQRDCVCGEPWRKHAPDVGDVRGYCLDPDCKCPRYQPQEVARGG